MLRTFRIGGIHPPENKLSAGKKITGLAIPKQVIIPLSQHIGAPAQAVVKKGDHKQWTESIFNNISSYPALNQFITNAIMSSGRRHIRA